MKVNIFLFPVILCASLLFSCKAVTDVNNNKANEGSSLMDLFTSDVSEEDLSPESLHLLSPFIDSIGMSTIIHSVLWKNNIEITDELKGYFLEPVSDLEYLPYLHLCATSPATRDSLLNTTFSDLYLYLCSSLIDDKDLFKAGKNYVDEMNRAHEGKHFEEYTKSNGTKVQRLIWVDLEYPDSFGNYRYAPFTTVVERIPNLTYVDTLRVKAVIHNDRQALTKLEEYYRNINDEKGIAIYYKVMMRFKNNYDLAERYYKVLAPALDSNRELYQDVRNVLLQAASHNVRAKELCDSLGFSPKTPKKL